ncbi:MAG: N-acetyltransferase family protein [Pseudomonadota bacterium]
MSSAPVHKVRPALPDDAAAIAEIYNRYVLESTATFELETVGGDAIAARMAASPAGLGWLVVADPAGGVIGYASVAPWKPRGAYRQTVETSVYLHADAQGRGVAKAVYARLLDEVWSQGYHAALAGIALPNAPSVGLHERLGFLPAGVLREVGFKFGRWIDVGYWQALNPTKGDDHA